MLRAACILAQRHTPPGTYPKALAGGQIMICLYDRLKISAYTQQAPKRPANQQGPGVQDIRYTSFTLRQAAAGQVLRPQVTCRSQSHPHRPGIEAALTVAPALASVQANLPQHLQPEFTGPTYTSHMQVLGNGKVTAIALRLCRHGAQAMACRPCRPMSSMQTYRRPQARMPCLPQWLISPLQQLIWSACGPPAPSPVQ